MYKFDYNLHLGNLEQVGKACFTTIFYEKE
jgi:hypothetical protein